MVLIFCSRLANVVLVNFTISRRVVRDVCDRGVKAVFIKENIKCMILVAGFISNT